MAREKDICVQEKFDKETQEYVASQWDALLLHLDTERTVHHGLSSVDSVCLQCGGKEETFSLMVIHRYIYISYKLMIFHTTITKTCYL